jgi:DNA-binding winged helix-turn-helix (wHTH) protein/tetratricopeptide (TPR) repeat protein
MRETRVLEFVPFRLDLGAERLWLGAQAVPLTAKAFAVLRYLVIHAGRLVTRDELFEAVWALPAVSDAALTVCIGEIRRALGDTARPPQFLETVRGRGYRFCAPVRVAPSTLGWPAGGDATVAVPQPDFLVGREAELAELQRWWAETQRGARQIVMVTGEAGIGKTTLVDAFVAQVTATADVWLGHGQCLEPYGTGEAYLPLLEAFGQLGRGPEGARLVELLRQHAPSWLLQMPSLVAEGEYETLQRRGSGVTRDRMLRELTEAVEVLTAVRPLLLVLEDLHWSDAATLDWLAHVARRRQPARLLVLGTYRPMEAMVREHPVYPVTQELLLHGQGAELVVGYLPVSAVQMYLAQRFGMPSLAEGLAEILHQRTSGNPLFFVTVVDELVRQGVIHKGLEGWTLEGGLATVAGWVPERLRQLIERQTAQLPPAEQRLLEAASVVGVEFTTVAVAAGLGGDGDEVEEGCARLAREQFLRAAGTNVWPDGTVTTRYGFRHALYQEVFYARIPAGRRARWHGQFGARLEAGYGRQTQTVAAVLAEHFDRGGDHVRSVQYLRQAAQNALRRSAHREAVQYYERALQMLEHLPPQHDTRAQAIDLHLELRNALIPLGEYTRILAHMQQAETLSRALPGQPRLGLITSYMTHHFFQLGELDLALAYGQRALAAAGDDLTVQIPTQLYLGYAYHARGDYPQAIEVLCKNMACLAGARQYDHFGLAPLPIVSSGSRLAICCAELGEFPQGLAYGEEALQIAEAAEHTVSLIQACRGLGVLYLQRGRFAQAIMLLERSLSLSRDAGLAFELHVAASSLGSRLCLLRAPDRGHTAPGAGGRAGSVNGTGRPAVPLARAAGRGVSSRRPPARCSAAGAAGSGPGP